MSTALTRGLSSLPGRGRDLKLGYRIQLAWPRIVGELMARYLFPVDVSGDKLVIGVISAVFLQEAEYQRDSLLANISAELGAGAIRHLQFRMLPSAPPPLPGPTAGPPPAPELPERPLTADEEAHLTRELQQIADPALREQMRRILSKALRRYPQQ